MLSLKINKNLILKVMFYGVLLNVILPFLLKPFATDEEIKPPNGASKLSVKGQLMHMFVHHAQVPVSSSIIVAVIIIVSVILATNY